MSAKTLPEEVQEFLRDRVRSFEDLETLLLLRNHPGETWSAERVASKLNISSAAAQESLDQLGRQNLLDVMVGGQSFLFAYNPGNPALRESVDRLVRAYTENRIEVMKVMSSDAVERVRGSVKAFADAFLLGRKKDG